MNRYWAAAMLLALGCVANASGMDVNAMNELIAQTSAAETAYLEAQQAYAREPGDAAAERLRRAEQRHAERSDELDSARIATLAEYSGRVPGDIQERRMAGSSWTGIAREIGVHPSVIGIEIIDDRPPPFERGPAP